MSAGSKHTLVQFRSEGAKQLPLTNAPTGWAAQQLLAKTTEVFPEVLGTVHKELDYIEGLSERDQLNKKQQQLLLRPMS
jgi:hypothetical protein